jgi:predicted phage terminase large subunit-like protein
MQPQEVDTNKLRAQLCKIDFYEFVQYFWDTIIAEQPIWNWHIKYICDELQEIGLRVARREKKEYDYYIINVPPGSSKSTIVSEMYPLWCWVNDPTQRFICGSYASTPAEDISEKCYNIYTSDKFKALYPHLVKNTTGGKTNFKNGLLGERYTTSTGSGITGIHAHQIICDDPMSPSIASSLVERDRANKWISETISSRKVDKDITVTIIVMQRLHEADTTGFLLAKSNLKVKHICIPAQLSEDVKPIALQQLYKDGLFDPIRCSLSTIQTSKSDLGSYGYAGQFMQRPSPLDGGLMKKNWFKVIKQNELPPNLITNFQLDPAYTAKQLNDPTGATAYQTDGKNIYILHSTSVWKEFPQLCQWITAWVQEYGYTSKSKIRVEPKASGKSVVQQLKQTTSLNIIEDDPPKDDKVTRVNSASPKMESGRVFLVEGNWNESFLNQIAAFPNGLHDDEVDNLTAIIHNELNKAKTQWVWA